MNDTRKLCEITGDELEFLLHKTVSEAGYPSVTAVINDFNAWGMTVDEFRETIKST